MKVKNRQRGCESVVFGVGGGVADNFHVIAPPTLEEKGEMKSGVKERERE